MPFRISYRFGRADYVALSVALSKTSPTKRLMNVLTHAAVLTVALVVLLLFQGLAISDLPKAMTPDVFGGYMPTWMFVVLVMLVASVAWKHWFSAALAFFHFRGLAFAGQTYEVDVGEDGIELRAPGVSSHVDWSRVLAVIECRDHLFLKIDKRQAVGLPRRAFADDAAFRSAAAFVETRIGPGLPHVVG